MKLDLLGLGEMAAGLFLASPADEALTFGIAAPLQLPTTALLGALLFYDGAKRTRLV